MLAVSTSTSALMLRRGVAAASAALARGRAVSKRTMMTDTVSDLTDTQLEVRA